MKVKGCRFIDIACNVESDGKLYVTECNNKVPFSIQRIFWVKDVIPGASRGNHATKKTKLILVPVSGSCNVLVDDGENREIIPMTSSSKGLYIEEMIWRAMQDFSPDCVMMAICDRPYEPGNETFEDYEEFLKALENGKKTY